MPGPAPNKHARRRNKRPDWRTLPAAGRSDDTPAFPLPDPDVAVLALWIDLWRSPQAVAWDELNWTRVVARYAQLTIAAEKPDATGALLAEVRQLEDRLGLTPMAMKRLQWEIGAVATDDDAEEADNVASLDAFRSRLSG